MDRPVCFVALLSLVALTAASGSAPAEKKAQPELRLYVRYQGGGSTGAAGVRGAGKSHQSPVLQPDSELRLAKDYPMDVRPGVGKHFDFNHPYPTLQEDDHYDQDYVKDENSDNGEWKAQMVYDTLRSELRKSKQAVIDSKHHWGEQEKDVSEAKTAEAAAEIAAKEAEKKADLARGEYTKVEDTVKHLGDAKAEKGAIHDATGEVKDEMTDFEKCKKELEEAKDKLKDLLKEKERREQLRKKARSEVFERQKEEDYSQMSEKELEEEVKETKAKQDVAETLYKETEDQLPAAEEALQKAASRLRKFRKKEFSEASGGLYYEATHGLHHSFAAAQCGPRVWALLAVLVVAGTATL